MADPIAEPKKPLGIVPFVLAALAFIPGLGIFLGIPTIVWGFIARSRDGLKVAAIAGTGVALNIVGYGVLFYIGVREEERRFWGGATQAYRYAASAGHGSGGVLASAERTLP